MNPAKATYKDRAEAFREFIQARSYAVSRAKFYEDCRRLAMIEADKSVSLASLDAYVRQELKLDAASGQSLVERDLADRRARADTEKAESEARRSRLAVERIEREQSDNWIEKEDAWAQLAGIVGELRDALRHQFHLGQGTLIHLAAGDPARGPEVYEGCDELIAKAMNKVCAAGKMERVFEREED